MAAREARARLLAPPFLVMGVLAACGNVEAGDDSNETGGPTDGGSGGSATAPYPEGTGGGIIAGTGGAFGGNGGAAIAGIGGAFGGNGGAAPTAGNNYNPPPLMRPCPFSPPAEGERCTQYGFGSFGFVSPPMCAYPASSCEALCQGEFWTLRGSCAAGAGGETGAGGDIGRPEGGQPGTGGAAD